MKDLILFVPLITITLIAGCRDSRSLLDSDQRASVDEIFFATAATDKRSAALLVSVSEKNTSKLTLCQLKEKKVKEFCENGNKYQLKDLKKIGDRNILVSEETLFFNRTQGTYIALFEDKEILRMIQIENQHAGSNQPGSQSQNTQGLTQAEIEVVRLINEYRASLGLSHLTIQPELNEGARQNSLIQEQKRRSGHYLPLNGGEIAFYGPLTPQATFQGWKNSPGHDQLMRGRGFKSCGVSAGSNGNSWTVRFFW